MDHQIRMSVTQGKFLTSTKKNSTDLMRELNILCTCSGPLSNLRCLAKVVGAHQSSTQGVALD
jgi:hypothetical protein